MALQLKRFQVEHYPAYASWFVDEELNRHLGPMDEDWLKATVTEPETAGMTWAVFRNAEFVAVVETWFDPDDVCRAAITALAARPGLRQQGIGTAVLELVLSLHKRRGITTHVAYISPANNAGRRCAEKVGFTAVTSEPKGHGYIEYQHSLGVSDQREGAVVLLENAQGQIAFQLRDNRPDVSHPDYWGLFGGWLEAGETPTQAIRREMDEELGLSLEAAQLKYIKLHRAGGVITHVFRYPAPIDIVNATLREGQRLEFMSLGELPRLRVVPRHKDIVEWYDKHRGTASPE